MQVRSAHPLRSAPIVAAALAALTLAACGGDDDSTAESGPDPATVTPPGVPVYAEATVRPEGEAKEELTSALSKLLDSDDPGGLIVDGISSGLAEEDAGITWEDDVEPWLGSRAAFFLSSVEDDDGEGALIAAATDTDAARDAIEKAAEADEVSEREAEHGGVTYTVDADGDAAGIVGDFLVAGTERGVEDAIDASSGESLADDEGFADELAEVGDDPFATARIDVPALLEGIERAGEIGPAERRRLSQQLGSTVEGTVVLGAEATADSLAVTGSAPAGEGRAEDSDLLASFPADSWLAFAAGEVGSQISAGIEGIGAAGGRDAARVGRRLRSQLGIDPAELDWIGDVGGFVQGTSLFGLGGGLVIRTDDADAAADAVGALERALRGERSLQLAPLGDGEQGFRAQLAGVPVGFEVALRGDEVVVAAGGASAEEVLDAEPALEGSDRFEQASGILGDDLAPSLFLDFPPVLELIEGTGQVTADPDYQSARPYLEHLDYLIAGSGTDGDRGIGKLVLGLTEGGPSGEATAATLLP